MLKNCKYCLILFNMLTFHIGQAFMDQLLDNNSDSVSFD